MIIWHNVGRPCGAEASEAEGITEYPEHVTCPVCLRDAIWKDVLRIVFNTKTYYEVEDFVNGKDAASFKLDILTSFKYSPWSNQPTPDWLTNNKI